MDYFIQFSKAFFIFNVVMGFMYILTWLERKQSALMQDRIGANRADILGFRLLGLFHPLADVIKLLTKEDFIPPGGNRLLHTLAPFLAMFFALISFAVIPFGGPTAWAVMRFPCRCSISMWASCSSLPP